MIAVTGLIMVIPFLMTGTARRMRRGPLSARFATRDAARHRHRTTPAVAAIMIVVAGATGLSFALAGTERADELRYVPALPEHVMSHAHDLDAARDVAENLNHWAYVEGDYNSSLDLVYLGLIAGAGLVTLIGVGVTVALAAAEGRADLATLAAVGAPPRRRRSIAGWQAFVVGGLGTVLGVGLGVYYAYLIWPAIGALDFVVPWRSVVLIGLAIPLLAVAVAAIFTPSRMPMIRRVQ